MKIWACSDLHVDYKENLNWFLQLSNVDYREDILILAGDISSSMQLCQQLFKALRSKFKAVLYVPGNHDLWLEAGDPFQSSLEKFDALLYLAQEEGITCKPYEEETFQIIPIFSWYDLSFGPLAPIIQRAWKDFKKCQWSMNLEELTEYFHQRSSIKQVQKDKTTISFSHFVPNKDFIPEDVPRLVKQLIPVFGSQSLGQEIEALEPSLHIYGHSHLNRSLLHKGTWYFNNSFGYPSEDYICKKMLRIVYENGNIVSPYEQWPEKRPNF